MIGYLKLCNNVGDDHRHAGLVVDNSQAFDGMFRGRMCQCYGNSTTIRRISASVGEKDIPPDVGVVAPGA